MTQNPPGVPIGTVAVIQATISLRKLLYRTAMILSKHGATLLGLLAPMLWGMSVGVIREICESFGFAAGTTLFSIVTVTYLLPVYGFPKFSEFPLKYLLLGVPFATASSAFFCTSLYLASDSRQAVEVGMINYLWPCLIIIFAVLFNGQKARWWIIPGVIISFFGISMVLGGDNGIQWSGLPHRIGRNPLSYGSALAGAVAWAVYSNLTKAWANGKNPVLLIFLQDSIVFGLLWLLGWGELSNATPKGWFSVVLGAVMYGVACLCWNVGVMKGNMTVLSIASYFTPVLSCIFSVLWLGAELSADFWNGVFVVVAGSLVCWHSTLGHDRS